MSVRTFCDLCGKPLTRNMVTDRLMVEQGHFRAEVLVSKDGDTTDGDLCCDCLIKILTTPPKKPRKSRSDKGSHKPKLEPIPSIKGKVNKRVPEVTDSKIDNLTIHTPTGLYGDNDYRVSIAGSEASGISLRLTVMEALKKTDGKIPDCLNEQERKTIQGILDVKNKK